MSLSLTHDRITAADMRCREIVTELKELPSMEYCDEGQRLQIRGLNQEFLWSTQFIINQCQHIIDSDEWGYDSNFQWKMHEQGHLNHYIR